MAPYYETIVVMPNKIIVNDLKGTFMQIEKLLINDHLLACSIF